MTITIIGAGPGGYETALQAAKQGAEVILVEAGAVGGTCLNAGCIPTKALCKSAELLEELRHSGELGINVSDFTPDFPAIMARKNSVVEQLRGGVEGLLSAAGVRIVHGRVELIDSHAVKAIMTDSDEIETWTSDYIIIATGSRSASLPIPGADLSGVLDSTDLLNIKSVPESLCIIGAGVIGLEFASVFSAFGSKVTVVEYCKEVLPRFESDIAKRLRKSLSSRGIDFYMSAQVEEIFRTAAASGGEVLEVRFTRKGASESVVADKVLMAVGRRPSCFGLGLEAAGVDFGPKGITVDGNMRTNVPSIFAIGDVNGLQMLAHAASFQGKKALKTIFGESATDIDLSVMPAAVFTLPEVASVGLTTDECKEKGIEYKVHKSFYRANGKALCMNESEGICILVEGSDGRILGCHIMGAQASALVQEVSVLMSSGASLSAVSNAVHIHPSLNEIILAAAE